MRNKLTLPVPGRSYSKDHACRLHEHGRKQHRMLLAPMPVQAADMALRDGTSEDWKREFVLHLYLARACTL